MIDQRTAEEGTRGVREKASQEVVMTPATVAAARERNGVAVHTL